VVGNVGNEGDGNLDREGDEILGVGTLGMEGEGGLVPESVVGKEVPKKNDGNVVGFNSKDGDRLYVGCEVIVGDGVMAVLLLFEQIKFVREVVIPTNLT
jgi:hypothetical protein